MDRRQGLSPKSHCVPGNASWHKNPLKPQPPIIVYISTENREATDIQITADSLVPYAVLYCLSKCIKHSLYRLHIHTNAIKLFPVKSFT